MITLVFVHGTGVRKHGYDDTLAVIREQVAHRPDVRVAECRWGEAHGCQLHADGESVPTYDATRALGDQLTPQQVEEAPWGLLCDPFSEIRLHAVRGVGRGSARPRRDLTTDYMVSCWSNGSLGGSRSAEPGYHRL